MRCRFEHLLPWFIVLIIINPSASRGGASPPVDSTLWQAAAQAQIELEQRSSVLDHPGVKQYVDGIVIQLWEHTQSDFPSMQVRILQNSREDAFTYPNGVGYLTIGMVSRTRSRNQLAMIIAHEMIHYIRQHIQPVSHGINPGARWCGDQPSLIDEAELQADREGFDLITQAGFDRDEALAILPGDRRSAITLMMTNTDIAGGIRQVEPRGNMSHSNQIAPVLKVNARNAVQEGLWVEAENCISRYLLVQPDDPEAYFLRGEILRLGLPGENGDTPEYAYLAAIKIDNDFVPALQALGMLFFKNGQCIKARRYFERCLFLSPYADASAYIRKYLQLCGE